MLNENPTDVWIIADSFVCEAGLGGLMLGEVTKLDMSKYNVVKRLTQENFDKLMTKFFEKNGHFPDT